jgi:hypothetical protein
MEREIRNTFEKYGPVHYSGRSRVRGLHQMIDQYEDPLIGDNAPIPISTRSEGGMTV